MPKLADRRHELYAQALAIGCSQQTAAKRAGFTAGASNKAFLSRLANRRDVKQRVEELKKEASQRIHAVMTVPSAQNCESLADMGLTMDWVTEQFQSIYDKALKAGNFAAANTAVQNIQKLIEARQEEESGESAEGAADKISVKDTLALLSDMKDLFADAPKEGNGSGTISEAKVNMIRHRHDN